MQENAVFGFLYGRGTQQAMPFNSEDYSYSFTSLRVSYKHPLKKTRSWQLMLTLEPALYTASHQLLNTSYVQPHHGEDYLEQREVFSKNKQIREYAFDLGVLVQHQTFENLGFFFQGSIGPMLSDTRTERLAKGFAFSDIISLGANLELGATHFTFRTGMRHVSNFNLQFPNSGYNAVLMEAGLMFQM